MVQGCSWGSYPKEGEQEGKGGGHHGAKDEEHKLQQVLLGRGGLKVGDAEGPEDDKREHDAADDVQQVREHLQPPHVGPHNRVGVTVHQRWHKHVVPAHASTRRAGCVSRV